ncbi:MAG: hypothetical protein H6867_00225 [Rhodospirillales bacterium]|nr:hypothetical protein [Rhodospirillales bacterium]MCB9996915.1 hypothetical protein [Rhodospirillales bacterium]
MKNKTEDSKAKTATRKAQSGQLIVNASDVDNLVSQNVNFMPKAPMAIEDCDGGLSQNFFRAPTRLSAAFDKKKHHNHDDGIGIWMMAVTVSNTQIQNAVPPPTHDHC